MKLQVIGDANTVSGFSIAGVQGHIATTNDEAYEILERLSKDEDLALIVITKRLTQSEEMKDLIDYISQNTIISIVEIPDNKDDVSGKEESIDRLIKRAVGFNIKY
ncbi:MAG: V-type ATP synthase subunit F [Candidatus Ranarchaeia archaeon]|jgi:V/A-type H+-transporting ATPase subunit F